MTQVASPIAPFPPGSVSAPRRRGRMQAWRRRSRLIRFLRRALPAMIAAILVLLAGWVTVRGILVRFTDLRAATGALIHMSNAKFYGRDGDRKAYILGANEAARDNFDPHRIVLTGPILALDSGDPRERHISADRGVYRDDTKILLLHGRVSLRDPGGDNLITDQAIVDTAKGTIVGQGRVYGSGPTGTITAESFAVFDRGQRVVFRGEVHSVMKRG
jgi:lipopolysaccharide export system protein LptC